MRFRNYYPCNTCDKIAVLRIVLEANLVCGQEETGLHECMVKCVKTCCESLRKVATQSNSILTPPPLKKTNKNILNPTTYSTFSGALLLRKNKCDNRKCGKFNAANCVISTNKFEHGLQRSSGSNLNGKCHARRGNAIKSVK